MGGSVGAVIALDGRRRRRHDVLAELREVDHWRRLVAARLDLAVAALTDSPNGATEGTAGLSGDLREVLREVLGLPNCHDALPEARILLRLRSTLRELDQRAEELRALADTEEPAGGLTPKARHRPIPPFRRTERGDRRSMPPIPPIPPPPLHSVTPIRPRAAE